MSTNLCAELVLGRRWVKNNFFTALITDSDRTVQKTVWHQSRFDRRFARVRNQHQLQRRGQRTEIYYGNNSMTRYFYDANNFRLIRLLPR